MSTSFRPNAESHRLTPLSDFSLVDLEGIKLVLRGGSVIDWHRLNFRNKDDVWSFLTSQEFLPESSVDRKRIEAIKGESIAFLKRHFNYPIPRQIADADIEELFLMASGTGHRQTCACTILKCMHIIHHLEGRELMFVLPLSQQEVFQLVEEKVYRIVGGMLADGFPIAEFVGGRKNKDSLYTKLLSKQETFASQIYDKLRFRIVTKGYDSILPVIRYLTKKLFPFNYVVPGQSINSMIRFKEECSKHERLRALLPDVQPFEKEDLIQPSDNRFSADTYRVLHFVVDMPIRLPEKILRRAPKNAANLGDIAFVICEFQVIDQETEAQNELGEASHAKYKERQKKAVMRRLQLGTRESLSDGRKSTTDLDEVATRSAVKPPARTKVRTSSVKPLSRKRS